VLIETNALPLTIRVSYKSLSFGTKKILTVAALQADLEIMKRDQVSAEREQLCHKCAPFCGKIMESAVFTAQRYA